MALDKNSLDDKQPAFPVIAIFDDMFSINYEEDYSKTFRWGLKELEQHDLYDQDGYLWNVKLHLKNKSKFEVIKKLLFWFKKVSVIATWNRVRNYELIELKNQISNAIDNDDDVLTQFVEGEEFKRKVSGCNSYAQLIRLIDVAVINFDQERFMDFT